MTFHAFPIPKGPVKSNLRGLSALLFMTYKAQLIAVCCQVNKRFFFVGLNRVASFAPSLNSGMNNLT